MCTCTGIFFIAEKAVWGVYVWELGGSGKDGEREGEGCG